MLSLTGSLKLFVAVEPCDLRRGHNGLLALVGGKLKEDVQSGALFVFSHRRHRLLKILHWDGTGLWMLSKRLENGTFSWPQSAESDAIKLKLTPEALTMLTDGIVRTWNLLAGELRCANHKPYPPPHLIPL